MLPTTIFLFAHQDDEIGVMHVLATLAANGRRVLCLYLTNGAFRGNSPQRRNKESLRVLAGLGVGADAVRFIGTELDIPDGALAQHLVRADAAILACLAEVGSIERIIMHAYEGGHQDHDAAHVLGIRAAQRSGTLASARQFTLYRATALPFLPHVMFRPLAANGPVEETPIPVVERLRFLLHCLSYRSQPLALLGLLPLMAIDYLFSGRQKLQPVAMARLVERPHPGALLYERRNRAIFADVNAATTAFLDTGPTSLSAAPPA